MSKNPDVSRPPDNKHPRAHLYILGSIIFLTLSLTATHIFLNRTSVGSQRFIGMTFLMYTVTFLVVLALLILATMLGRNLIKLYFEKRRGQPGSGFKTKLVMIFIGLSLLPALILFVLAYTIISGSIENWFRDPPVQVMENSRRLIQQYYAEVEEQAKFRAETIADRFRSMEASEEKPPASLPFRLREAAREYGIGTIRIIDLDGRVTAQSAPSISPDSHQDIRAGLIAEAIGGRQGFGIYSVAQDDPWNEISYATAPLRDADGGVIGAVLVENIRSRNAKIWADAVVDAYEKYEQLKAEKTSLRFNVLLMLVLSTLLIVFAFSWFAMYLAKRITVPIQSLVHGAAAVAAGNLSYRVECQAFDELEGLVASFNRMTGDLQENEKRIETVQQNLRRTNVENEERRRYIETILQTISTGVVALDAQYNIRAMNRAAMQLLQAEEHEGETKIEDIVQAPACDALRSLLNKADVLGTVVRNIELVFPGKSLQIAATVTALIDTTGRRQGWVVVLDDMTELIRMEKMSAWQEVARRLAHEIKNPLTPIQLSAERILKQYTKLAPGSHVEPGGKWQDEFARFDKLLTECVRVIIQEAGSLKNLVDEFSRFARLPEVRLENADVNFILENTLNLYNGQIRDISIRKELDRSIPPVRLDPEQMKRVFINLFDNALEAMAQNDHKKILNLRTSRDRVQGFVRIEIGDSGAGFPREYRDSVFLPYFSIRKGGTGLGLAIVRQIVSDHHGNVRAEANIPVGTKIIIDLPLGRG
jgi:two-component system, NtrC family, nitrogen regulation sensor histidine kinase NtrY